MKKFLFFLVLIISCQFAFAGQGGKPQNDEESYDYNDYLADDISTKSWTVTCAGGETGVVDWEFYTSPSGNLVRKQIYLDGSYTESEFVLSDSTFGLIGTRSFDEFGVLVNTTVNNPPTVFMTSRMVLGEAWGDANTSTSTYSTSVRYYKIEPLAIEDVSVTAGYFSDCLKIFRQFNYSGNPNYNIRWHCPDVGVAKFASGTCFYELESMTYSTD